MRWPASHVSRGSTYAAPSGGGELRRLETPPLLTAQPSRRQRVHHSSTAAPQRLQPHCRVQGAAAAGPHGARKPRRAGNIIYIMHMQPPRARPRGRDGLELTSRRHLHSQRRRVKWAAWEAARSSTRGSGWAPSGPVSPPGSAEPPRAARRALGRRALGRRALRRRRSRAGALWPCCGAMCEMKRRKLPAVSGISTDLG